MRPSISSSASVDANGLVARVTYQLSGFDRLNFVSDVTAVLPLDGSCIIQVLRFEADGIKANGWLTVQMREEQPMQEWLVQRLRSVQGMVSVREIRC